MVIRGALQDDRPEQLARERRGQLVRSELLGDPELLLGHEEEQPEQLGLDRGDRPQDVADRQRVRRREDGLGGDPRGCLAARASPRPDRLGDLPVEDLA